jgi:tRNA nucleotidyltransferase (CCA-adding enzyme)
VVGLLTRRAVDRPLAHRLNLPASSLMESGEVTVQPNDSIEHLRRVMIESGWGQVPVVDPEQRAGGGHCDPHRPAQNTSPAPHLPGRQNLARLEEALPPARLALAQGCGQRRPRAARGGLYRRRLCARFAAGPPQPDFDVVVEGDAIALANTLVRCYGGRVQSHSRFGTAKWNIEDHHTRLAKQIAAPGSTLDPWNCLTAWT